ncbi:MAG: AzlC family ABC transporter permease [Rhodomicrobium sp.]|nr:AzlC family ABC transporter permease [Rhodomicrobium sp.]
MDGSGPNPVDPKWAADVSRRTAAWRGARETPFVPAFILFSTFIGFGALTSETGFSWLDTLLMSAFIFALPGQIVLVDQMARGASILAAAIAVTATGVRLLPMTVALLPMIRDRRVPKWMEFAVAYFVAVTVWIETMRRAPHVPRHLRAAYTLGISGFLVFVSCAGALIGFILAANVSPIVAAGLLFMTPIYFLLSMLSGVRTAAGFMPILFGLLLGPAFHMLLPSFDLVLTGLIGGTASFAISHYLSKDGGGA